MATANNNLHRLRPSVQTQQVDSFEVSALASVKCGFCRRYVHAEDLSDAIHGEGLLLTCGDCIELKRAASRRYQRTPKAKLLLKKSRKKHRDGQRANEALARAPLRAAQRARERLKRQQQADAKRGHPRNAPSDAAIAAMVASFAEPSDDEWLGTDANSE